MKKFYIPIFAAVFLLTSFFSQAQVTYISIASNPSGFTLDDTRFWTGVTGPPPNPCNLCTIKIFSDVFMVQQNGGAPGNGGKATTATDGPFLNHVIITNSTINLYGATTVTVNTYLDLRNVQVTIGNDPTSTESIVVNDQISIDAASSIQEANNLTLINTQNLIGKTIIGPFDEIGNPGFKAAGIYSTIPLGGTSYTQVLEINGMGSALGQYQPGGFPYYIINCKPNVPAAPNSCDFGLIYGPAATQPPDPTFGVLFGQSTTLPVVLVQFLATKNDDGSVKINWATSQEQNSNYYDVERTSDQSVWASIGTVKAKGYSSTTSNYFLNDKLPIDGTGYYRLKMVDLDGKFTYSKAISVTTDNSSIPLVIYSNPFSDQIRLKINVSGPQNLILTVTDMMGKTYISQSYQAQNGDNFVNLQPSIGSSGMYILRIQGNSYDQTVKLEKQ
jgi:Secretion system C-terminal sorting domain